LYTAQGRNPFIFGVLHCNKGKTRLLLRVLHCNKGKTRLVFSDLVYHNTKTDIVVALPALQMTEIRLWYNCAGQKLERYFIFILNRYQNDKKD